MLNISSTMATWGSVHRREGVVIDQDNAFLAASIDGEVHDPNNTGSPVGNLEMKYKLFPEKIAPENNTRLLVTLAPKTKNFCLELTDSGLRLKSKHPYYSQVQGGMAIRRMQRCDFVVYIYTSAAEDIHVEHIYFDPTFWVALKATEATSRVSSSSSGLN